MNKLREQFKKDTDGEWLPPYSDMDDELEAELAYSNWLEARDEEHLAKIEKQTKTILNQADKIADFVKYFEGNECRKGLTAKPCHCEAPKKELSTLKQSIDESEKFWYDEEFTSLNVIRDTDNYSIRVKSGYVKVALLELKDGE